MEWIHDGFDALSGLLMRVMPPGDLQNLVVHGALAGVAAVVMFLPQIVLLFLFIGILEDSGYMARAAYVMDRVMGRVGLHGKSFIPLLSSFACAIPGIMATRTIENPKDRLATMLVAPLMSCSARLPVYTLLIAAFIPVPGAVRALQPCRADAPVDVPAGAGGRPRDGVAFQKDALAGGGARVPDGASRLQAPVAPLGGAAGSGAGPGVPAQGRDDHSGGLDPALVPGQLSAAGRAHRPPRRCSTASQGRPGGRSSR